jgi:hypothetical protein
VTGLDDLQAARAAMVRYRDGSLCGSCKEDAEVIIDTLDKSIDFEGLMREYVAKGASHPRAALLPERRRQIAEARDEVAHRLGHEQGRPTLLQHRPGEAIDTVRSWRTELGGMIPRPLGLLAPPSRPRRDRDGG